MSPIHLSKKMKHQNLDIIGYRITGTGLNVNVIAVVYIYRFSKFGDLMTVFQKIFKNTVASIPKVIAVNDYGRPKNAPPKKKMIKRGSFLLFSKLQINKTHCKPE